MSDDIEKSKSVLMSTRRILEECQKLGWQSFPINILLSKTEPSRGNDNGKIEITLSDGATHSLTLKIPIQEEKKVSWFWRQVDEINKRLPLVFVSIFAIFLILLLCFMGCESESETSIVEKRVLKVSLATFAEEKNFSLVTLPWKKGSVKENE